MKTAAQQHFKLSKSRNVIFRNTWLGNVVVKALILIAYNIDTAAERLIYKYNCRSQQNEKAHDVEMLLEKQFRGNYNGNIMLECYKKVVQSAPSCF